MGIQALYVDGGVIASNPSMIGGTYAWRLVYHDGQTVGKASVVTVAQMLGPVTNNQTEMLALLVGLSRLPDYFDGTIYSDSQVTLGRAFMGWKWKNIPQWMHDAYKVERKRLTCFDELKFVLLDGHPTKAQLQTGVGKRGNPCSEHNVWCDEACSSAGEEFMRTVGNNVPSVAEGDLYVI